MKTLFGIPTDALALGLLIALAIVGALVVTLALRNRVFMKLGVRNVRRGRGRTVLIVVGLMLGTAIIASALGTGDSMSKTVRSTVLESLGETDVVISVTGTETAGFGEGFLDQASDVDYFNQGLVGVITDQIPESAPIGEVAPAIIEPVAVQDRTSRQNEPRVTLFAPDPLAWDGFDPIRASGQAVSLADLGPSEVYINRDAAEDLGASAGDTLAVLAGDTVFEATVADVVDATGTGTAGAGVLMPLAAAQELLARPNEVKHVLVANDGGVGNSDAVVAALEPILDPLGLEAVPSKQDGIDVADENGAAFMSLFTTFGTFTIAAGILLIFLIFVMLATERRSEMGTARAIGTQRGHLVQTFLFEGFAYDLLAAAVGTAFGIGIAYAMVQMLASSFSSVADIAFQTDLQPKSLVIAYALGVMLTFAVVVVSSWRVSRLNIVTAIRNLPDPSARSGGRARWVWLGLLVLFGFLLTTSGAGSGQAMPLMLGVSLLAIAGVLVAKAVGVPERLVYTTGGLALMVWWLLPISVIESIFGQLSMDFSMWIVGGLIVVMGATWTVMYNADVLIGGMTRTMSWARGLAPVLKTAMAYPLRTRFRTGMTMAMFTLVVFTLVTGATISGSFIKAFDDEESFGGGFDIRSEMAPATAVRYDMHPAIGDAEGVELDEFDVVAAQSFVPVDARQTDANGTDANASGDGAGYVVRGLDDNFLEHTTYALSAIAEGYDSTEAVWESMRAKDGLAVVDGFVAPRRDQFGFGPAPDFQLNGFYVEDGTFDPVPVEVTDPQTGATVNLTVIGVLADTAPETMIGISTAQETLFSFGERARPTVNYYKVADGVDAEDAAARLESAFLANGMEAETMANMLEDAVGVSWMFNRLIQGFLGLGLVVGVAALAVISARSVVERRQQIGVLRALGFQRSMVRKTFLLEASFISLASIVVGTTLGLIMAWNVVSDSQGNPGNDNLAFTVPWLNLLVVFAAVYLAAMLAALLPARRAARVFPAEALRYQ